MTIPAPDPEQQEATTPVTDPTDPNDTTVTDELVERTDNGLRDDDPGEQPPQNPEWLPDGTATGATQ